MAVIKLNIDTSSYSQSSSVILDNVEYVLEVYYNARMDGWYISFYDPETYSFQSTDNASSMIYGGRRLMPNQDVFSRTTFENLPSGRLYCIDTDLSQYPPRVGRDNFGTGKQYELVYFTEDEF